MKCCERDTDGDGDCDRHPRKRTVLKAPSPYEAEWDTWHARLAGLNYPGFTVERERRPFERVSTFVIRCDGAADEVSVSDYDAVAMRYDLPVLVTRRIIEAAERIWSRWMAL